MKNSRFTADKAVSSKAGTLPWVVLLALVLSSPHSFGQQDSKTAVATPVEAVLRLHLDHREGVVPLYYSACCRERALEFQKALEDLIAFYKERLGVGSPLVVAVLDENDWKRVGEQMGGGVGPPYGLTSVAPPPGAIAFIPADDQGVITKTLLADRPFATPATLKAFASARLTYDEAARRFIRHPAFHEVGHTLVFQYGIQTSSHWLNEMLASYFAYAYEKARDQETAAIVEGFTTVSSPPVAYTSLPDFETHMRMPPANYDWYQRQFAGRVIEVYNLEGLGFLAKVKAEFPAGTHDMSVADTLSRLEAISPGFEAWAKGLDQYKSPDPVH
jgi:hypothetical protein